MTVDEELVQPCADDDVVADHDAAALDVTVRNGTFTVAVTEMLACFTTRDEAEKHELDDETDV